MRKKLRLKGRSRLTVDKWSGETYTLPPIPVWAFGRHLRRRANYYYRDGTAVMDISDGWYIHSYRNGIRMLCALPF